MVRGFIVGLMLVSLSAMIHTTGLIGVAEYVIRFRERWGKRFTAINYSSLLSSVFGLITLLHLAEIFIWAALYRLTGLLGDSESAFYFSIGSYTTMGATNILLPQNWRLLGGLESMGGMLLFGLSTAFLFALMRLMFQSKLKARSASSLPYREME